MGQFHSKENAMKILSSNTINVGGLLKLILLPQEAVVGIRKNYQSLETILYYQDNDEVVAIDVLSDKSYQYTEEQQDDDAGDSWTIRLNGVIPAMTSTNEREICLLERKQFYVVAIDQNGSMRLVGEGEVLPRFLTTRSTGAAHTDLNGISFKLENTQANPSIILSSLQAV